MARAHCSYMEIFVYSFLDILDKVIATNGLKKFHCIALLLPNAIEPGRLFLLHTVNCVLDLILVGRVIDTQNNQYISMGGVSGVGSLPLPDCCTPYHSLPTPWSQSVFNFFEIFPAKTSVAAFEDA